MNEFDCWTHCIIEKVCEKDSIAYILREESTDKFLLAALSDEMSTLFYFTTTSNLSSYQQQQQSRAAPSLSLDIVAVLECTDVFGLSYTLSRDDRAPRPSPSSVLCRLDFDACPFESKPCSFRLATPSPYSSSSLKGQGLGYGPLPLPLSLFSCLGVGVDVGQQSYYQEQQDDALEGLGLGLRAGGEMTLPPASTASSSSAAAAAVAAAAGVPSICLKTKTPVYNTECGVGI